MYAFPIPYLDIEFCVSSYLHRVLVSLQPPSRYQSRTHLTSSQRRGASSVWCSTSPIPHFSKPQPPSPETKPSLNFPLSLSLFPTQPAAHAREWIADRLRTSLLSPIFACVFPRHETPERPDTDTHTYANKHHFTHEMENLSLDGPEAGHAPAPPLGPASGPASAPGPNQQLPPQMFTTAAQLLDMTDSEYT
jgi:hypothetical protein